MYSLWRVKVVPTCCKALGWLNQRRKAIQWALGPQGALPSRKNSVSEAVEADQDRRTTHALPSNNDGGKVSRRPSRDEKGKGRQQKEDLYGKKKFEEHYLQPSKEVVGTTKTKSKPLPADQDETDVFFSSFEDESRSGKEDCAKSPKLPAAFFCPITKDVMSYPVIAADGHTYERAAIQKWLREHKTSPTTNLVLRHTHVIPNHSLKSAIQEFEKEGK